MTGGAGHTGGWHRGRAHGPSGGSHRWGGTGPTGGGTHALHDSAGRLLLIGIVALIVLAAGGLTLVITLSGSGSTTGAAAPPDAGSVAPGPAPGPVRTDVPPSLQAQIDQVVAATPLRFDADSSVLAGDAATGVDRLAGILRASPDPLVTLEGHTAPVGETTSGGGTELSQARADAVAQRLESAGVQASRLRVTGVGSAGALASTTASRRVEVRVG